MLEAVMPEKVALLGIHAIITNNPAEMAAARGQISGL